MPAQDLIQVVDQALWGFQVEAGARDAVTYSLVNTRFLISASKADLVGITPL